MGLLYKEFPRYFVWDAQTSTWFERKQGIVIGRLCVVNIVENERYYLRLLLNNVRCPTSLSYLLTVNGITYNTFQEAADKRGLLHGDDDVDKAMEEASIYRMSAKLCRLFATLLHYCGPSNPKKLFQHYFQSLVEDFIRTEEALKLPNYAVLNKVLQALNDILETLGRDINEFNLVDFQYKTIEFERLTREINAEKNIPVPEDDMHALYQLNAEQRTSLEVIFRSALGNYGGMFFIDGPRGTGKSFLYNVLLANLRSQGYIYLIVASSGIVASGLLYFFYVGRRNNTLTISS